MLEGTECRRELRALLVGHGVGESPTDPLQLTGSTLCLGGWERGCVKLNLSPEKVPEQGASMAPGALGAGGGPDHTADLSAMLRLLQGIPGHVAKVVSHPLRCVHLTLHELDRRVSCL